MVGTARVWAFVLMFLGYYASLTIITERFSREWVGGVVAYGLSFCAAWFLRPTVEQRV